MTRSNQTRDQRSLAYWLLFGFLIVVFLGGGASRVDPLSLAFLRPMSIAACGAALLTLRREHWQGRSMLLVMPLAMVALVLLQLIPLPPELWQAMPGRANIAATDRLAGLGDVWRPLSLAPLNSWHALLSLFVPLAVILLGVQLSREEVLALLPLLVALTVLSAVLGVIQIVGGAGSPAYLYRITNRDSVVGLFSNRNHAALLFAILFPMLAVYASSPAGSPEKRASRGFLAVAVAAVTVPILLLTGSRAGLVLMLLGLVSVALLYRRLPVPVSSRSTRTMMSSGLAKALAVLAIALPVGLAVFMSRAQSFERLLAEGPAEESRFQYWQICWDMLVHYFPFGSGAGSFAEVYQVFEPDSLLNPTYLNRAHNDWMEIAITLGLPGIVLLLLTLALFALRFVVLVRSSHQSGRATQFHRLAGIMIVMIALASIPDYPLRTPIFMSILAICGLWLFTETPSDPPPSTAGA